MYDSLPANVRGAHYARDRPPPPRYESNALSTRPGPARSLKCCAPSKTHSPFTHTPCSPIGARTLRIPPAGRSDRFSRPDTPTRRGIEEHKVGPVPRLDGAAVADAITARRVARQAAHAFLQREGAGLAHPVRQEMKAEAGVAEVDEMRSGVGQRDDPGRVLEQRCDARIVVLEELRHELRVERQVEHELERVLRQARSPARLRARPATSRRKTGCRSSAARGSRGSACGRPDPCRCARAPRAARPSRRRRRRASRGCRARAGVKSNDSGWQLVWMYTSRPRAIACAQRS